MESAALDDRAPEELRRGAIILAAGELVQALKADHLRDLRVGVQAVEHVAPLDHGRKQREMRELRREIEVALLARDRVQVREHLVHTAVLAIEHLLHLLAGQRGDEIVRVSGEPPQRFQRGIARCMPVRIAQPGEDLVHRVPGHAMELAPLHAVLELARAVRKRADQAAFRRVLAGAQLGHDVVDALLEHGLAGRGEHQRAGGQVMAERVTVAADLHPGLLRLPAAVDGRLGRKAGVRPKVVQHAVGLELQQIAFVALLGRQEGAGQQAHVGERKGLNPRRPVRALVRIALPVGRDRRHRARQQGREPQGLDDVPPRRRLWGR